MRNKKMHVVFAVVLSIVFLSGCAFGTRHPMLEYNTVTPVKPANNISIKISTFSDTRPDKNVIGNVRNGWGMKTADVITDTNIADWVSTALKSELKNAGYNVIEEDTKNLISGEVLKVYCDTYLNYEGEVMIKVVLKKDNSVILDKTYSGKSSDLSRIKTTPQAIFQRPSLDHALGGGPDGISRHDPTWH